LQAVSTARSALPDLEAALTSGRGPRPENLGELQKAAAAFAEAADTLAVDPEQATLAGLLAELAVREKAAALRHSMGRLGQARGPAVADPTLASPAAEADHLAAPPSWSHAQQARAETLARLVELADLAARDGDDERIVSLDAELRQDLGLSGAGVILAAARGQLLLPENGTKPGV
jgi:hypothetical protein